MKLLYVFCLYSCVRHVRSCEQWSPFCTHDHSGKLMSAHTRTQHIEHKYTRAHNHVRCMHTMPMYEPFAWLCGCASTQPCMTHLCIDNGVIGPLPAAYIDWSVWSCRESFGQSGCSKHAGAVCRSIKAHCIAKYQLWV